MSVLDEIQSVSDDELLEMLKNAAATYYCCHGHQKASRNEYRCEVYREELIRRGVSLEKDDAVYARQGTFNGKGAS